MAFSQLDGEGSAVECLTAHWEVTDGGLVWV